MKVLVTGGAGFIGSHVVDRLLGQGADVRILDSLEPQAHPRSPDYLDPAAELVVGDVRDRELVRRSLAGVDRLVHLAARVGVGQSMYQIERYVSANAVGAAVVLEEAAQVARRLEKVVVASSMSVYGEGLYRCPAENATVRGELRPAGQLAARRWELSCPSCGAELEPVPTPEDTRLHPASVYAVTKRDHEELFLVWGRSYGVPVTALRFFNVFGPRQQLSNPYTGVAAIFAARLLNGRPPVIFEDGRQTRDFVHVADVAAAVTAVLEPGHGDGLPVNVGCGRPVSVLDVARSLARELGVETEPEIRNTFRAGDVRHCFADISLARATLGFAPRVAFEQGMRELAGWLADREAEDRVVEAAEELAARGLTG